MISEIQAAIASATGIQKIVKTMMEINTNDAVREKGVELNIVISDLLTALTASLVQNYQLVEASNLLKKKMAEINDWKRESKEDTLHELVPSVYSYQRNVVVDGARKPLQLCPKCHNDAHTSILQFSGTDGMAIYFCPRCDLKLTANH